ncbi:MAG: hypothetical protein UT24_C0016G0056 [Candidatus Woesebacteria bacterium GW2011_GWB1_39_12]|uniref:Holin n=1 Tax=Candidatus Woesebacteria bacterium GW2011_GWB1_39_12 TaxID=1618574 RepID=A0A0G0QEN5_9BACT|nr:MAG: hypothetical protein UT24_C0016G0056 [Candidatus Woesebacteria bacterium GW2011_GWB1_39_12]
MEQLTSVAVVIGFINGVKLFENPDKKSFMYFCFAIVLGVVFGFLKLFGISGIENGLIVALTSSGLYKISTKLGGI